MLEDDAAASARPLEKSCIEEKTESSESTLASKLVTEGDMTCGRVTMGFGIRGPCWSPECSFCIDLRYAKVDFMIRGASESLLSDGRRLLRDGA
jgi:hypothetical protein